MLLYRDAHHISTTYMRTMTNELGRQIGAATGWWVGLMSPPSRRPYPRSGRVTRYPLGATYDGAGTNFSLFSEVAERVELCLIAKDGSEERVNLDEVDGYVWHCYLPTVTPVSATASGCTAHGIRRPATAAIRASCCWTRTASRSTANSTSPRRCSPTTWKPTTSPRAARRRRIDSLGHTMTSVVINPFFTGHPTARRARRTTRPSSTRPTSRA